MIKFIRNHQLFIVILLSFVHGMIYAFFLPPWGLADEEQHVDYIHTIVTEGRRPIVGQDFISEDIIKSVLETKRHERFMWPTPPSTDPKDWGLEGYSYEGYQPPLFYLFCSLFYWLVPGDVTSKFMFLKLLMVLLSTTTLLIVYKTAQEVFPENSKLPYLVTGILLLIPERTIAVSRVNNDVLVELLAATFFLIWVKSIKYGLNNRKSILLGLVFGLGVITKTSFFGMGLLFVFLGFWNFKKPIFWKSIGIMGSIIALITVPFLIGNYIHYGDFTGFNSFSILLSKLGWMGWPEPFSLLGLLKQLAITFGNFWFIWWKGGEAVFSKWLIPFYLYLVVISIIVIYEIIRGISRNDRMGYIFKILIASTALILIYIGLVIYGYYSNKFPVIQGRFFISLYPIISILLVYGINNFYKSRILFPITLGTLALLDVIWLFGNQLRYFYYISPVEMTLAGQYPLKIGDQFRLGYVTFLSDKVFPGFVFTLLLCMYLLLLIGWLISDFNVEIEEFFSLIASQVLIVYKKIIHPDPLFIVAAIYFILVMVWSATLPDHIFWSLDEGGKYLYLENLIKTGEINAPFIYPGVSIDPMQNHIPLYFYIKNSQGVFSWWPYWFPLVSYPFYLLLGWYGLFIIPALSGALIVGISGQIIGEIYPKKSFYPILAAVLTGFATPVLFYSTRYWEHSLASALFLTNIYLIIRGIKEAKTKYFIFAGLVAGLAGGFRIDIFGILLGVGLGLLFLHPPKAVIWGGAAFVGFLPFMLGNLFTSGNIFGPTYISLQGGKFGGLLGNFGTNISQILFNSPLVGALKIPDVLLIVGTLSVLITIILVFIPKIWYLSILSMGIITAISIWALVQENLYRSVHGVLLISPLIIFGAWSLRYLNKYRENPIPLFTILGSVTFMTVYLLRGWEAGGGLQWGPRYFLGLYPLFSLCAIEGMIYVSDNLNKKAYISILSGFLLASIVSFGFEIRGLDTSRRNLTLYEKSSQVIKPINSPIIYTRCTWLGMVIPDLYWKGNLFVGNQADFEMILLGQGIQKYLSIDMISCNTDPINLVEFEYKENPGGIIYEEVIIR